MNLCKHIAAHLLEVHTGNNWTDVNLLDSLRQIDVEKAQRKLPNTHNSIAMLLHHILFWNKVLLQRIEKINLEIPDDNGFLHPPLPNQAAWQAMIQECMQSATDLAHAIENYDESKLFLPLTEGGSTAYKNFHGQAEHVHYHLGQIVILKKALKS